MRHAVKAVGLALVTAFVACGEGDGGGPVKVVPPFEAPTTAPESPVDGAPIRTVERRNPYGNVAVSDNLLWDGDFEWRPSFADQYGWLVGSGFGIGFGLPRLATASSCRSGIKCAYLAPGDVILGITVGSFGHDLAVSFWARPETGVCEGIQAVFIPTEQNFSAGEAIGPTQTEPLEDGWCRYETLVPERGEASYLSIENMSGSPVVIDDAVVVAAPAGQTMARSHRGGRALTPAEVATWEQRRRAARKQRLPRNAPPSRGQRLLRAHLEKLAR